MRWGHASRSVTGAIIAVLIVSLVGVRSPSWSTLAHAQATDDLTPYLPAGASIVQMARGDTDGDGAPDTVALYTHPGRGRTARAGLLILAGPPSARVASYPFGMRPDGVYRLELDEGRSAELTLRDLSGDGAAEVLVTLHRVSEGSGSEQIVWLFRRNGTEYRLELHLEGQVTLADAPDDSLRVRTERQPGRMDTDGVALDEVYRWRADGFRLAERAYDLTGPTVPPTGPLATVLRYYQAIGAGDYRAAYDLLGGSMQAQQSYAAFAAGFATTRGVQVEEIRRDEPSFRVRDGGTSEGSVYVRVLALDARPDGTLTTRTFAGVWQVGSVGGRPRLLAAQVRPAPSLIAVADALPGGSAILQTAQGDLRGSGADDVGVIVQRPESPFLAEPYVLLRSSGEALRATRLADLVMTEDIGGVGGSIWIGDVTGDDRVELVYNAVVGAHSSILWILGWDGERLGPRFAEASNTVGFDLVDLDRDGIPEIVMRQSGYCRAYAVSPQLTVAFRWTKDGYRPASADFPDLQDDELFQLVRERVAAEAGDDPQSRGARACLQHMLATAYALKGRLGDAWTAYQGYHEAAGTAGDSGVTMVDAYPVYIAAAFFLDQIADLIARAESGRLGAPGSAERALLHNLRGNALEARALASRHHADAATRQGNAAEARAAWTAFEQARDAATTAYRSALAIDPSDREAHAGLARLDAMARSE